MRELKFRAWTRQKPSMPWSQKFVAITGNGEQMVPIGGTFTGVWHILGDDAEGLIIEQYTGLKDNNGKEIYEGDIVKARWYRAKNARLDTRGEIKFNDGWFYIKDDPDGQDRLGVPIHNCYDIEIVGNIHEGEEEK